MFVTCSRLSNPAQNTHVPAPVREFGKTCDIRGRMLSSAWDAFDCLRGKNPPRRVSNVRATFSRHLQELLACFTADSAMPLDCGWCGLVRVLNRKDLANTWNSSESYCGPLSDTTLSGISYRAIWPFNFFITILVKSPCSDSQFQKVWKIVHSHQVILAFGIGRGRYWFLPRDVA